MESTLQELQQQRSNRLARSTAGSELAPSEAQSASPSTTEDEGKSLKSFQSDSFVHASQVSEASPPSSEQLKPAAREKVQAPASKKTKAQLWNELKVSCKDTDALSMTRHADHAMQRSPAL